MKKHDKPTWTVAEQNLLLEYFYTLSRDELFKILPDWSLSEILSQVAHLKKANKEFSK